MMENNKEYWGDAMTKNCVWLFQLRAKDSWRTVNVFLTKREALAYGDARPYEWGKFDEGWRIYGVMCIGLMAEILGRNNKEFEKDVEHITEGGR